MKRLLLILGAVVLALLILVPVGARFFGPRLIYVPPPTGVPIGEYDVPRPETSVLGVSIVVPMTLLSEIVSENVPEQFEGQERKNIHKRIENGAYAWAVARGPIQFDNTGDSLAFGTPFSGAARFQGDVDARLLTIPLNTTAEIAGVAGGSLQPTISPDWRIDPALQPRVELTNAKLSLGALGQLDVSDMLGGTLGQYLQRELGKLAPALRRGFDLRSEVEPLWREAFVNRLVSDDPEVWVSVTPNRILAGPIDYSVRERIALNIGIQSQTYLTNRDPGAPVPAPIPNLTPVNEPVETLIRLPVIVGMTELNEVLAEENLELDTGVGADIEISGMEAEVGQDGRLNLKLDLEADKGVVGRGVTGEIWVTGRPIIDIERQTLGFTDVELTVETRDKLAGAAAWLVEGILVRTLEAQLRVDLDDYQAEIDEEVKKALDSGALPEGLEVSLEDFSVQLADIYTVTRHDENGPEDPGIVIVISATGDMETRLDGALLDSGREP